MGEIIKCQDKEHWFGFEVPCKNPAKFIKRAPAGIWPVCGVCARKYLSNALTPFRIKEWPSIQKEIEAFDKAKS
jgi:hypothetical protein